MAKFTRLRAVRAHKLKMVLQRRGELQRMRRTERGSTPVHILCPLRGGCRRAALPHGCSKCEVLLEWGSTSGDPQEVAPDLFLPLHSAVQVLALPDECRRPLWPPSLPVVGPIHAHLSYTQPGNLLLVTMATPLECLTSWTSPAA